ncbi:MAG: exodeoxyribonuclease VII small subunit [Elusimicrobiaceae bacterium]|nr:exodeoxyribonuclease VII small subunit [Elusimicrobiaceae bacterium]
MTAKKTKQSFEEKLARLETIVSELETDGSGLEQSITLFEEGVTLSRELEQQLTEVKRRVELITRTSSGELKKEPFETDASAAHENDQPTGA